MTITTSQAHTILHALNLQARHEEAAIARLKKSGGRTNATVHAIERHTKTLAELADAKTPIVAIIDAHTAEMIAKLKEDV